MAIDSGHVRSKVAPGKFYVVETWATEEEMTDLSDSFSGTTLGEAQKDGYWQELDLSVIDTVACPTKNIGNVSVKSQHSCKSLWKVIRSPEHCQWVPGCKFMKKTDSPSHWQLYMDDGSVLDADVDIQKKDKSLHLSVLSHDRLNGYMGRLSLERTGKASCDINYHFNSLLKDSSPALCYSDLHLGSFICTFHNHFIPGLHMQLAK